MPTGLIQRLAGAASVHLWRKYLLEAGLPVALEDAPELGEWARGWVELLDEVEAWRLVEAERDALNVSSALLVGTVPRAVWVGIVGGVVLSVNFLGLLWGLAGAIYAFAGLSVLGLTIYAWNERVRRRRLAAARRVHAAHRREVGSRVRALLAGPLDVTVGEVRYRVGTSRKEDVDVA